MLFFKAMNLIRHRLSLITLLFCCLAGPLMAQTPKPQRPQADRWLLIVDTSSAMKSRNGATLGVVGELVSSGMNGQMKPGAELSIWTYNKELSAGVAPKQLWNPPNSNTITRQVLGYLGAQEYQGKAQFPQVLVGLTHAISVSTRLTVVWLSDGSQKISGTPFDDAINTAAETNKVILAKTRMPLVTVLRGYHGQLIGQSVSIAPWPVEFPAFPPEPEKTNAVVKGIVLPSKPVEMGKPLIMSGANKPATPSASAEAMSSSVTLRPPPDTTPSDVTPQAAPVTKPVETAPSSAISKPMETVSPLPLANVTATAPVAAPVEPTPIVKAPEHAAQPKTMELAAATPALAVPAASKTPAAPATAPATKVSSSVAATPAPQVAMFNETVTTRKWPLILGISLMWVAIVVALVLMQRARRANASSLITRSLERR